MVYQVEPLAAAEFQQWLKPAEALAKLPSDWTEREKRSAILRRLADGSILAVAKSCVVKDRGGTKRYAFTRLEPKLWSEPWNSYDHDLWKLGDVSFDDAPPLQMVYVVTYGEPERDDRPTVSASFKDVRFDPVTFAHEFESYLEVDEPDEAGEEEARGKPIAAAELERFARLYLDTWCEKATEMNALAAIRACYPGRTIGRDTFLTKFRELRGPGKRGKPPIRGK